MNFLYYDLTSAKRIVPFPLQELATNIVTDWMPGVPNSIALSLADLLGNILEEGYVSVNKLWSVKTNVAGYEKQWRQVTSWMLAVACCRKVIEMEGYNWWAPVSAFTPRKAKTSILTPYWLNIPKNECLISQPEPKLSNFYPDYILAGYDSLESTYNISFAESKGTHEAIGPLTIPHPHWVNQAKNAVFSYGGFGCPIKQNIVVATRVNPAAIRFSTRKLVVSAWNSKHAQNIAPMQPFYDVLRMHYFGVCEQLGLDSNACLIALNSLSPNENVNPAVLRSYDARDREELRARLVNDSAQELRPITVENLGGSPVLVSRNRPNFIVGNHSIQVGLTEPASTLLRWLQGQDAGTERDVFPSFYRELFMLNEYARSSNLVTVRSDGVYGQVQK